MSNREARRHSKNGKAPAQPELPVWPFPPHFSAIWRDSMVKNGLPAAARVGLAETLRPSPRPNGEVVMEPMVVVQVVLAIGSDELTAGGLMRLDEFLASQAPSVVAKDAIETFKRICAEHNVTYPYDAEGRAEGEDEAPRLVVEPVAMRDLLVRALLPVEVQAADPTEVETAFGSAWRYDVVWPTTPELGTVAVLSKRILEDDPRAGLAMLVTNHRSNLTKLAAEGGVMLPWEKKPDEAES